LMIWLQNAETSSRRKSPFWTQEDANSVQFTWTRATTI
jgi:hypothetical protein